MRHVRRSALEHNVDGTAPIEPMGSHQRTLVLDQNLLVWLAEVNGFLVDLRHMPREVQEIAFARGIIPYIPGDQEHGPERPSPDPEE